MAKFIEADGWVFKVSERNYKKLLKNIATTNDPDINKLGKVVATDVEKLYDIQGQSKSASWCRGILDGDECEAR